MAVIANHNHAHARCWVFGGIVIRLTDTIRPHHTKGRTNMTSDEGDMDSEIEKQNHFQI